MDLKKTGQVKFDTIPKSREGTISKVIYKEGRSLAKET